MSILLLRSPQDMLEWSKNKETIGFVPTMGALHDGHVSLVERSKKENFQTVVSIFVNPAQFNDSSDFENYPQTLEQDLVRLEELGVDCVFAPSAESIYPDNYRYRINENHDSQGLCGGDRPGHFDGVLTVVMKLFNIVSPDRAYFGEKDFQQLQLVKDMAQAFFLKTQVIACPTVRSQEGLALSSRNSRLSAEALKKAQEFPRVLQQAPSVDEAGAQLKEEGFDVLYVEERWQRRLAAVSVENVRLIDNIAL